MISGRTEGHVRTDRALEPRRAIFGSYADAVRNRSPTADPPPPATSPGSLRAGATSVGSESSEGTESRTESEPDFADVVLLILS